MKLQSPGNGEVSMTRKDFRRLALSFPETTENEHMDHPDFRVRGKIFATFGYPDERWGMVKLMPDQQVDLANAEPDVFVPVKGAWGRRGATSVLLRSGKSASVKKAFGLAWRNAAPKKLSEDLEEYFGGYKDLRQTGVAQNFFNFDDIGRNIHADGVVLAFHDANLVAILQPSQLFELLDALEFPGRERRKIQ